MPASQIEIVPAAGDQVRPAIATNGKDFLVAWVDGRPAGGVYVARVEADGTVLDRNGIRLSAFCDSTVVVLRADASYVVTWLEGGIVMLARLNDDAQLITAPRPISGPAFAYGSSWAATNGTNVAIAYVGRTTGAGLRGLVVTASGDRIAESLLPVKHGNNFGLSVGASRSDFLFAWLASNSPNGEIDAVRMSSDGHLLDATARTIGPVSLNDAPIIASDGDDYLLLYRRSPPVVTRQVSADLATIGAESAFTDAYPLRAVWDGSNYVSAATTPDSIAIMTFDQSGKALGDPRPIAARSRYGTGAVLATAAGRTVVVWSDVRDATAVQVQYDLFIAASDSVPDVVTYAAASQQYESVAFSGQNYMATWFEDGRDLRAGRISLDGTPLDGRGMLLAAARGKAKVVFNGRDYVVAWSDGFMVNVRSITPAGVTRSALKQLSFSCGGGIDLAAGPSSETLLLVGRCARRIGGDGTFIDKSTTVLPTTSGDESSAAWNGRMYLVAWREHIPAAGLGPGFYFPANIRAARLNRGAQLMDPQGLNISVDPLENDTAPRVASNGKEFAIAYVRSLQLQYQPSVIHVRPVSESGAVLDDITLDSAQDVNIAWAGTDYFVSWVSPAHQVVGTFIGSSGDRVVIAKDVDPRSAPSLSFAGGRRMVLGYARIANEPQYAGVYRVFVRMLDQSTRSRTIR
jgi:hypothetical protein